MTDLLASALILAWVAILVLALAMAGLLRQIRALSGGRPFRGQIGPPTGGLAPGVPGLEELVLRGHVTVLLFLDTGCDVCAETLRTADDLVDDRNDQLFRFVAIFSASADGDPSDRIQLIENGNDIFTRYGVSLTPFGVAINDHGHITHTGAIGSPALLRELVNGAANALAGPRYGKG